MRNNSRIFFRSLATLSAMILFLGAECRAETFRTDNPALVRKMTPAPGDTVVVSNGTYSNAAVTVPFSGTPEARIVLKAETPGGVVFEGKSYLKIKGSYLDVEGFVLHNPPLEVTYPILVDRGTTCDRIRECCVWGDENVAVSAESKSTKWACLYGTHHEMERCSFDGKRCIGLMVDVCFEDGGEAPNTVVHNCFFRRPYSLLRGKKTQINGQESFRFGSSTYSMSDAGGVCRDNWFYECNGEIEVISNKSSGNLYENNLFENCGGELTLRHGNNCTVRRNIFLSDGNRLSGGVRVIGEGHVIEGNYMKGLGGRNNYSAICIMGSNPDPELYEYWPADNCVVRNNTVVDCRSGIYVNHENHCGGPVPPKNLTVEKNVFVLGPNAFSVTVNKMDPSEIRWRKNVIYGGTQTGTSYKESSKAPNTPDATERAETIRRNAGVSYKYKQ